jgi:hypothetical protein
MTPLLPAPFLALLALPALAASASDSSFSVSLDASKMHESCVRLEKGETARFEWKSDQPLDFNIHYHVGNEVFYPVKKDGVTQGKDTFKASIAQDYCWMWTASKVTQLEGSVRKP